MSVVVSASPFVASCERLAFVGNVEFLSVTAVRFALSPAIALSLDIVVASSGLVEFPDSFLVVGCTTPVLVSTETFRSVVSLSPTEILGFTLSRLVVAAIVTVVLSVLICAALVFVSTRPETFRSVVSLGPTGILAFTLSRLVVAAVFSIFTTGMAFVFTIKLLLAGVTFKCVLPLLSVSVLAIGAASHFTFTEFPLFVPFGAEMKLAFVDPPPVWFNPRAPLLIPSL